MQGLGSQMGEGSSRQRDHCDQRQEAQPRVGSTYRNTALTSSCLLHPVGTGGGHTEGAVGFYVLWPMGIPSYWGEPSLQTVHRNGAARRFSLPRLLLQHVTWDQPITCILTNTGQSDAPLESGAAQGASVFSPILVSAALEAMLGSGS